jgi:iron complex outermembrane receptor protein
MRFLLILLTSLVFVHVRGQTDCSKQIAGTVFDKDSNLPIPFATIRVLNSSIGTSTDEKGNFILSDICQDVVDFEVRFLGFKTVVHQHDFNDPKQVELRHRVYLVSEQKQLESVVVEGQAVVGDLQSMSVNQIDKSLLANKTGQSFASAISDIQGVTFTSLGTNVQLPVIHGLYGNRILVINNGVKHGFQNWGTENAPEIDITGAENIAVLKGAAGVRYGPEALGGVVVLESNSLDLSNKTYGGLSTGYQTNGRGYHVTSFIGSGKKRFSYHVGGNYRRLGDRSTADYLLYNTGMEEYSANVGLRYKLPQLDFKAYFSYVAQELGILRPSVARSLELFADSGCSGAYFDERI